MYFQLNSSKRFPDRIFSEYKERNCGILPSRNGKLTDKDKYKDRRRNCGISVLFAFCLSKEFDTLCSNDRYQRLLTGS
jgi:hypothetical protein